MCHSYWLNKKMNRQKPDRISRQRGQWKEEGRVSSQTWINQDGHSEHEVTSMWNNINLKFWINLR